MFWSRGPSDRMIGVEIDPRLPLFFIKDLQSVIVHEDVSSATLHLVRRDGLLERPDSRLNDTSKALLVDRTLDVDVRQRTTFESLRPYRGIIATVHLHLLDGSNALRDAADDDLGKKLRHVSKMRRRLATCSDLPR